MSVIFRIKPTGRLDGITVPTITTAVQDPEGIYDVGYTSAGGNFGVLNVQELMRVATGNTTDDHLLAQIILTDGPATTLLELSQLAYNPAGPESGISRTLIYEYISAEPSDVIGPQPFLNYTGQRLVLQSDNGVANEGEIYVVVIPVAGKQMLDAICCTQGETPEGGGGDDEPCADAIPLAYGNNNISATTVTRYLSVSGDTSGGTAQTDPIPYRMQNVSKVTRFELRVRVGNGNGEVVDYEVMRLVAGVPTSLASPMVISVPSTFSGVAQFDFPAGNDLVDGEELVVEIRKALAIGSSPTDVQAFLQIETDCDGGGSSGGDFDPLMHYFYVAKNGSDATGTGSIAKPFLTLQRAYTEIGDAADNAEWNDPTKRYYVVDVAPGIYADGILLPVRPSVWTYLNGAELDTSVNLLFPNGLITSGIGSPQWGFRGNGRRAVWDGTGAHTENGITGDFQVSMGTGQGVAFFPQFHFQNTGVLGDVQTAGTFSGAQLFLTDSVIGGSIDNNTGSLAVWADGVNNEDAGDVMGIGGVGGAVNLFHLNNVLLRSASPNAPTVDGWRWNDVKLLDGGTFEFQLCDVDVQMDESTYVEYVNAVNIVGGEGFPQVRVEIDDGDPWLQQCDDAEFQTWNGADPAPRIMGNLTGLLKGNYHLVASAEILKDDTAGSVAVDFGLFKNGVLIDCTTRTESLSGAGGIAVGGSLTTDIIEIAALPSDNFTFQGVGPANVGTLTAAHYNLKAIRVGPQIPVEVAP